MAPRQVYLLHGNARAAYGNAEKKHQTQGRRPGSQGIGGEATPPGGRCPLTLYGESWPCMALGPFSHSFLPVTTHFGDHPAPRLQPRLFLPLHKGTGLTLLAPSHLIPSIIPSFKSVNLLFNPYSSASFSLSITILFLLHRGSSKPTQCASFFHHTRGRFSL